MDKTIRHVIYLQVLPFIGFPDREENKCYSFPEDGEVAKDYLNVVDEDSVVSSLIPANER